MNWLNLGKKAILSSLLGVVLAGCAGDPTLPHKPGPTEAFPRFGPWGVYDCKVISLTQDFVAVSRDATKAREVEVRLKFRQPLVDIPLARVNTLTDPLPVRGGNRTFSFDLPFTPHAVNQLQQSYSYLSVFYIRDGVQQQMHLPTNGLVQALVKREQLCS